jgi:hypothetical protein
MSQATGDNHWTNVAPSDNRDEWQIKFGNDQRTTTRAGVTVHRVKIDDEVIALDIVKRGEKRFVFEIMRDTGTAWLPLVMNLKRPAAQPGRESRFGSEQSRLHKKEKLDQ